MTAARRGRPPAAERSARLAAIFARSRMGKPRTHEQFGEVIRAPVTLPRLRWMGDAVSDLDQRLNTRSAL